MLSDSLREVGFEEFLSGLKVVAQLEIDNELVPTDLGDHFAAVEAEGQAVKEILTSAIGYSHIRKFGRETLILEERPENYRKGIMGHVWGAKVVVTRNLPQGLILVIGENSSVSLINLTCGLSRYERARLKKCRYMSAANAKQ